MTVQIADTVTWTPRAAGQISSEATQRRFGLQISELFVSIQGEGRFDGTRSVFLRTTGCNLRCTFCDTPYTSWSPAGEFLTHAEILARIESFSCEHVVLTGGEPLLQPEIVPLSHELKRRGHFITVETAGTTDRPVAADLMSISPKRANSAPPDDDAWGARHRRAQHRPEVMRRLMSDYDFQLKFVIDTPADVADVERYLQEFPEVEPTRVWLMPQGVTMPVLTEKQRWLEPAARERGFHFCPRTHIALFGNTRGT